MINVEDLAERGVESTLAQGNGRLRLLAYESGLEISLSKDGMLSVIWIPEEDLQGFYHMVKYVQTGEHECEPIMKGS